MGDNEGEQAPDTGGDETIENFIEAYVTKYSGTVEDSDLPDGFLPHFYGAYPYKVQIYRFENSALGVVFLHGDEAQTVTTVKDGEFHEVRWILEDKACEHFIALRSEKEASPAMAERLAEKKAEADISFSKKRMNLEKMKGELDGLEGDISEMVKVNPWLEERAADQMSHLSTTKSMVETMETEVEEEKYTRFREYSSQLDLLELQLPPTIGGTEITEEEMEEELEEEMEDDEIPTLAVIASEHDITDSEEEADEEEEEEEEEEAPQPTKEKKERPAYVEVKKEKVAKGKMETMPPADLPPEIKKTIFRMNRRLYNLEKKVEPLSASRNGDMKRVREDTARLKNDTKALQAQIMQSMDAQSKRMDASAQALAAMLAEETKKARRFAVGLGATAIIMSLLALVLILYNMGYLVI